MACFIDSGYKKTSRNVALYIDAPRVSIFSSRLDMKPAKWSHKIIMKKITVAEQLKYLSLESCLINDIDLKRKNFLEKVPKLVR